MNKLLILSVLLLAGCADDGPDVVRGSLYYNSSIRYTYDITTDLCYAYTEAGNASSFTIAPCTDKVLSAIERDKPDD